ncbi:hypothetical protein QE372_003561 [Agrobacterium pusense]|nr:hypothetical protein [Agrobacterium pusense]
MGEHIAAQIGNDPLADRHDIIITHRAGECENNRNGQKHGEVAVDHTAIRRLKTVIDDAANGERQGESRGGRQNKCKKSRSHQATITPEIRKQAKERFQASLFHRFMLFDVCHVLYAPRSSPFFGLLRANFRSAVKFPPGSHLLSQGDSRLLLSRRPSCIGSASNWEAIAHLDYGFIY